MFAQEANRFRMFVYLMPTIGNGFMYTTVLEQVPQLDTRLSLNIGIRQKRNAAEIAVFKETIPVKSPLWSDVFLHEKPDNFGSDAEAIKGWECCSMFLLRLLRWCWSAWLVFAGACLAIRCQSLPIYRWCVMVLIGIPLSTLGLGLVYAFDWIGSTWCSGLLMSIFHWSLLVTSVWLCCGPKEIDFRASRALKQGRKDCIDCLHRTIGHCHLYFYGFGLALFGGWAVWGKSWLFL